MPFYIHWNKYSERETFWGSSLLSIPIYLLFKTKHLKFPTFLRSPLVLKHYVVTVSVYDVFRCLLSYDSFLTSYHFCFCSYLGVIESKTEGNTWPGLFPVLFELKQPIRWAGISFSCSAGCPHCCYLPAFLLTLKYKVMCWSFCKYVQMWKYKLLWR